MKILAIDPATRTGYAHSDGVSGTWDLRIKTDESSGMRLIRLRAKLQEIHRTLGVDVVVFEANRNLKHGPAIRVAGQLQGLIELWCTDHAIQYRGYSAGEIKKLATGKGGANKQAMIDAAIRRWPDVHIEGDDHADALWLLELAKADLML